MHHLPNLRGRARQAFVVLLLSAAFAALPLLGPRPAQAAAVFTVNLPGDVADINLGDDKCDASLGAGPQCTLRAAIQQANATPGTDVIAFNIPGGGVKTIRPATPLPIITGGVIVDGYTQPGANPNTAANGTNAVLRIELDGSQTGFSDIGLTIEAPNTTIRGLVVNRFSFGIASRGPNAVNTRIIGCFLGTDPSGTADRGNEFQGVSLFGANPIVGGTAPAARNLISGNGNFGVSISLDAVRARVEGNLIGTAKDGTTALGNDGTGVNLVGANHTVGGNTAAAANVIAFNGGDGVAIADLASNPDGGNRILRNSIFANGGIGIDLERFGTNGPTPNDPGDADDGANRLQNTPILAEAKGGRTGSFVRGTLNSTPNATFTIRFFVNPEGGDEGKVFLGQQSVTTDGRGIAEVSLSPTRQLAVGETVTATATSQSGDTSEFSPPVTVV